MKYINKDSFIDKGYLIISDNYLGVIVEENSTEYNYSIKVLRGFIKLKQKHGVRRTKYTKTAGEYHGINKRRIDLTVKVIIEDNYET